MFNLSWLISFRHASIFLRGSLYSCLDFISLFSIWLITLIGKFTFDCYSHALSIKVLILWPAFHSMRKTLFVHAIFFLLLSMIYLILHLMNLHWLRKIVSSLITISISTVFFMHSRHYYHIMNCLTFHAALICICMENNISWH